MLLKDRAAIITGALVRGIGWQRPSAAEEGARIALLDSMLLLHSSRGAIGEHRGYACDVPQAICQSVVQEIIAAFGVIDI